MSGNERDMVELRMSAAWESLASAQDAAANERWRTCSNRIYYACFYAVLAVLCLDGKGSSKHSGVKSIFLKDYVQTGAFSTDMGRFYSRLVNTRSTVDYDMEKPIPVKDLQRWLPKAEDFLHSVENFLSNRNLSDE